MFTGGSFEVVREPTPWVKDYDALEDALHVLPARHRLERWLGLVALRGDSVVGTLLALADDPTYVPQIGAEGVWVVDIRVDPSVRGTGVGSALWAAAEAWTLETGRCELWVETQDVNVPACRFYQKMGCRVASVDARAYPPEMGETRVIWVKRLVRGP
ncbi:MAG: hypothetical protein AMXMBFR81_07140 [Chthonomonas sp.]